MLLVNYQSFRAGNPRSGLINLEMEVRPNLFPPSFLFLALTIQGTKSKVLGHDAERGGWSVPTSANQFKSKYHNYPNTDGANAVIWDPSPYDVRMPAAVYNMSVRDRPATLDGDWLTTGPVEFDQLPYGAGAVCYTDADAGWVVREIDNYALGIANGLANTNDPHPAEQHAYKDHRFGSRMIHFGDLTYMEALLTKRPMTEDQFGRTYGEAPTFTISMIDPNWIFTDVPNSTLQTLELKLLWGDTAEPIQDVGPYPVQVTLIASQ